ncbi:MAG TPA: two-component system sensor histidine kinase KdbD, partial [Pseudomonadales bacterium]|nr:two-component system sensor histidine kinase KdbD [Pseudomonadales bacterium]
MAQDFERRPDPDALLLQTQAKEAQEKRGKLKIFFGASPGVGKTYAMLQEARRLREQGLDVVVGVVESHGRSETAKLTEGLDILAPLEKEHRGKVLHEFDLDAALKRKPAILLVDELAHSNVPGLRHPKRWQDVEELLAAGINVLTTVNVQHIESLNDVVGGITGIRVWETVPDRVFDEANEVVLVDLPPEDLLLRLREGKVYLPEQAERAIQNFFRKGNLIALRELALRRTAERVDEEIRVIRREDASQRVWHTSDALLVCVGPYLGDDKVVRTAARLAARLNSLWHAICVDTPEYRSLQQTAQRDFSLSLKLAQDLGAETSVISAQNTAEALVDYARQHNLGKIVIGRHGGQKRQRTKSDKLI